VKELQDGYPELESVLMATVEEVATEGGVQEYPLNWRRRLVELLRHVVFDPSEEGNPEVEVLMATVEEVATL
jgi:hypothetical protein